MFIRRERVLQYDAEPVVTALLPSELSRMAPPKVKIDVIPTKVPDDFLEVLIKTYGHGISAVILGITNTNPDPEDNPELFQAMAYFSMNFKAPAVLFANRDPELPKPYTYVNRHLGTLVLANTVRHILGLPDHSVFQ